MKHFLKENLVRILCLLFLALMFIFWGRVIFREMQTNAHIHNLTDTVSRLDCLGFYGWEVDPESETRRDVAIPRPLDSVWENYNTLQKLCGFDLTHYQGEKATCYTYLAKNFPHQIAEPVYVNLLICGGSLIGGDCMTTALDGFMLPLDRRYLP